MKKTTKLLRRTQLRSQLPEPLQHLERAHGQHINRLLRGSDGQVAAALALIQQQVSEHGCGILDLVDFYFLENQMGNTELRPQLLWFMEAALLHNKLDQVLVEAACTCVRRVFSESAASAAAGQLSERQESLLQRALFVCTLLARACEPEQLDIAQQLGALLGCVFDQNAVSEQLVHGVLQAANTALEVQPPWVYQAGVVQVLEEINKNVELVFGFANCNARHAIQKLVSYLLTNLLAQILGEFLFTTQNLETALRLLPRARNPQLAAWLLEFGCFQGCVEDVVQKVAVCAAHTRDKKGFMTCVEFLAQAFGGLEQLPAALQGCLESKVVEMGWL